jgi:hypothetical protein
MASASHDRLTSLAESFIRLKYDALLPSNRPMQVLPSRLAGF